MNKNMLRTSLLSVLITALSLLFAGCSLFSSPEDAARTSLDTLKNISESEFEGYDTVGDLEEIEDTTLTGAYTDLMAMFDSSDEIPAEYKNLVINLFEHFEYEIQDSNKSGKDGTVKVKITNYDMEALLKTAMKPLAQYLAEENLDLEDLSYIERVTVSSKIINQVIADGFSEMSETEGELTLKKYSKGWQIDNTTDNLNIIYSNFSSLCMDPNLLSAEEFLSITFDIVIDMDLDTFVSFIELDEEDADESEFALMYEMAKASKEYFSYNVISSEEDAEGMEATVTAEFTSLDYEALNTSFENKAMEMLNSSDIYTMSEDQILEKLNEMLIEIIQNDDLQLTHTLEVPMYNTGDGWDFSDETIIQKCFFGTEVD